MDRWTATDLKNRLGEAMQWVRETQEALVITQRGRDSVVMIRIEDYEVLMELMDAADDAEDIPELERLRAEGAFDRDAMKPVPGFPVPGEQPEPEPTAK